MSLAAYSDLKMAHHPVRIALLRETGLVAPLQAHFILSDLCNQDCHFCTHRMSGGLGSQQFAENGAKNPKRMIPTEKAKEILDDLAAVGCRAIQFTGGGEPTVHPDHLNVFRYALDLGLECALVTNGVLLRPGWADVLREFKWIRVSLDSGNAQDYAKVRRVPETLFAQVLDNISRIASACPDTVLGVGFVVTRDNYMGIENACQLARSRGASYIRPTSIFSTHGAEPYAGISEDIEAALVRASHCDDPPRFRVVDMFGKRTADLDQGPPDYEFCGQQQVCTYIGGNQKVYRCCVTSYSQHGEIADLTNQRYRDWFNSEQRKQAFAGFDARTCRVCSFNGKNRTINALMAEPMHVNFV